jgi:hypothetical protein
MVRPSSQVLILDLSNLQVREADMLVVDLGDRLSPSLTPRPTLSESRR